MSEKKRTCGDGKPFHVDVRWSAVLLGDEWRGGPAPFLRWENQFVKKYFTSIVIYKSVWYFMIVGVYPVIKG